MPVTRVSEHIQPLLNVLSTVKLITSLPEESLSEYLSEFGYTVIQAKDGREALSEFNSDINLVILDIQIPFINGLEVLKEIRKKSNLPILILTAFSDEEYKIDAFTNLADGYIEKPFSLPVLKARIDSLIKKNYGHLEKFEYKDLSVLGKIKKTNE